jgi:agmatine/peptidylarginine deiminase
VIHLAAPNLGERYYGRHVPRFADELARLYVRLGQQLRAGDRLVVSAPCARLARLSRWLPAACLREGTLADIWLRDVAPVPTPRGWVKCRYRPAYCPADQAAHIDDRCRRWCRRLGLTARPLGLALDGGNLVADSGDQAILTEQVLADNPAWTRDRICQRITDRMGYARMCLLPVEPGDPTGHADGTVLWLSPTKLALSRLTGSHGRQVRRRLAATFPAVELVEVPYAPEGASATGIYVNALTTAQALYVPTYDRRSDDRALAIFEEHSPLPVVPVAMGPIGALGGSLRCLTWAVPETQIR